jgi:beta-galactosidase
MGVNAIRTSHNPPAPELLDLCDRMGLLVQDEAFDEFTPAKNKWVAGWNAGLPSRWGYAELFERWAVADIEGMVRRDRNHPSVIMWSIGNEIDYANDPFSHPVLGNSYRPQNPPASDLVRLGKPLVEAVRKLDPTRPVTAALANLRMSDAVGFPELFDIVGYNYQESRYAEDHEKYPQRGLFGSENGHQYNNWAIVRDNEYVMGQFLWTGIDYLGEARAWPTRGSSAGLLDTCGFKKPNAWFRQSLWSDRPMVYLCTVVATAGGARRGRGSWGPEESWNRPEGSSVRVICYTNCDEAQITLNDKPVGTQRRTEAVNGALTWTVPYEPGVLKAMGLENGVAVCEHRLATAGPAARIELTPDRSELRADGREVCHIEFRITDGQGVRVPDAQHSLRFEIDGPVRLLGIDNGRMTGPEDYRSPERTAWRGRGLAILQSTTAAGRIVVTAGSPGLQSATVELGSR